MGKHHRYSSASSIKFRFYPVRRRTAGENLNRTRQA